MAKPEDPGNGNGNNGDNGDNGEGNEGAAFDVVVLTTSATEVVYEGSPPFAVLDGSLVIGPDYAPIAIFADGHWLRASKVEHILMPIT